MHAYFSLYLERVSGLRKGIIDVGALGDLNGRSWDKCANTFVGAYGEMKNNTKGNVTET